MNFTTNWNYPTNVRFGIGRIERDQVEDYARRKGIDVQAAERILAPVLRYIP